ncbi:YrdB family protein [Paenibacillus glycanilyticus]|uniref:YrdB family protein n=1 Tax=Paenibacillus glycanilyticus TaxID=126569 RepID=UPI00203E6DDC|nr:YrdB family protein [Paenibacillus glycanilyticus]MCM3628427.1 YrdB family protein [Paenibacillus glycanilyticus]
MKALILTLFFVLELAALVVFGYWGYQLRSAEVFRILLAVAAPLAVAILWGLFLSPKASVPIFTYPVRTALKLVVFLVASAALFVTGHDKLGTIFLVVSIAIIGAVFIMKWHKVNN